jgi:hypothetical protein
MLSYQYVKIYLNQLFDFTAANCQLQTIYLIIQTAYMHLLTVHDQYIKGPVHCVRNHCNSWRQAITKCYQRHMLCDLSFP